MDLALTNRTVVITGAASGIGLASLRAFAAEGARVLAVDVNAGALEAALAGLPVARIGAFDGGGRLRIGLAGRPIVDDAVEALARAWKREGVRP